MTSLRLVYFPVRARAECARMILAFGGIHYQEEDCASYFGSSFQEVKAAGKLPLGQLPVLEVNGELIAQSGAINRYLASLVPDLIPGDPLKRAKADMVHETAQELAKVNPIVNMFRGEKWVTEKTDFFSNVLPTRLTFLAKALGNQQFFCGEKVSYCDFAVYHQLDLCRILEPKVLDTAGGLKGWMERVENLPGVGEYLRNRPEVVGVGENPRLQPKM